MIETTACFPVVHHDLIACRDCDLLHRIRRLPDGAVARCVRCGGLLYRERQNTVDLTLAYALTSFILFVIANVFPLLGLKYGDQDAHYTLLSGALELGRFQMWEAVSLVLATSVILPLFHYCGTLYIFLLLKFGYRPPGLALVFKMVSTLKAWSMVGVYMLGVLVATVKLGEMATVRPGIAVYALGVLLIVSVVMSNVLDPRFVWQRVGTVK